MVTSFQKIVCLMIYNKRYTELSVSDQAKVNTYINHVGCIAIMNHPELIKDNYNEVLRINGLSKIELEEEE